MALVDPADLDWSQMDDSECWMSAKSGIPQAIAEAKRRGLLNEGDHDGSDATIDWPRVNNSG